MNECLLPVHTEESALKWHGFTPFQIVSLQDMIRIFGGDIYTVLYHLESFSNVVQNESLFHGAESSVAEDVARMWSIQSDFLQRAVDQLNLNRTQERLNRLIISSIIADKKPVRLVVAEMAELKQAVQSDLTEITFFYMPPDHLAFWMTTEWSGVIGRLSTAIDKELFYAGRCFATENYTACVFHLMRGLELALKMVVRRMNAGQYLVTTTNGGKVVVRKPVELCDWETIIRGLEKALKAMEPGIKTNTRRKETYEFYSGVIASFRNFKDAWRNKVSHSSKIYEKYEAAHVITNTKQFLTQLLPRFGASKKI